MNASGTYVDSLHTIHGCDSIVRLVLTVHPTYDITIFDTICDNQVYAANGFNVNTSGTYVDSLHTIHGCDSIVRLILTVHPAYDTTIFDTININETYSLNGFNTNVAGMHVNEFETVNRCDSIVRLNLTVNPIYYTTIDDTVCSNEIYTANGFNESVPGVYIDTLITASGCDSIVQLNLIVYPSYDTVITDTICANEVYSENGFNVNEQGIYIDTLQTVNGCDSIVQLNLVVNPVRHTIINATIREDATYTDNGFNTNIAGTYYDTLQTVNGCDSIVQLNLEVRPLYDTVIADTICGNEIYTDNGFNINIAGTYIDTIYAANGRDSIVQLNLTVYPSYDIAITASICANEVYTDNGFVENQSGIYVDTLQTENGCDSIVRLELMVNPIYNDTIDAYICQGEIYDQFGFYEDQTIVTTRQLQTEFGCDSLVTLNLKVMRVYDDTIHATIKEGEYYDKYGFYECMEGIYSRYYTTYFGCDSSLHLFLHVNSELNLFVENCIMPKAPTDNKFHIVHEKSLIIDDVYIYNRLGVLMFRSPNNAESWDGKYKGEYCPQAAYTYVIYYHQEGTKERKAKTGTVLVLY